MDQMFERYLKQIKTIDVEYTSQESLSGVRYKLFIRMAAYHFKELFNELIYNPNCSYDTYINETIKSGHIPEFISVLVKPVNPMIADKNSYKLSCFAEVIASRMLNFFGCSTTYELFSCLEDNKQRVCCSVNFNKPYEEFYILEELVEMYSFEDCKRVDICEEIIEIVLNNFRKFSMKEITDEAFKLMLNKFKEDFIYSWLIRYQVMKDKDFDMHNVGLVYNKRKKAIKIAPNFDMEMCFNSLEEDVDAVENIINLQYVANAHPQVLERFLKKLREFKNETNGKTKIREIVENIVGSESENAERLINDLQNRTNKIYHLIQGLEPVKERLHRE